MALVDSLLTAMVRADGDALVMHVGERPIVVSGSRTIDLSTHGMNLSAMVGMLGQLLSGDALASLKELGAVEHALPSRGSDRFSVVAARSGDDIWIEIRRRRETHREEAVEPAQAPPVAETTPAEEPAAGAQEEAEPSATPAVHAAAPAETEPAAVEASAPPEAEVPPGVDESVSVEPAPAGEPLYAARDTELLAAPPEGADEEPVTQVAETPDVAPSEALAVEPEPPVTPEMTAMPELALPHVETAPSAAAADEALPAEVDAMEPPAEPDLTEADAAAPAVEEPAPVLASAAASLHPASPSTVTPGVPMETTRHAGPPAGGPPSRPTPPPAPSIPPASGESESALPETPVMRTVRIEVPARSLPTSRASGIDRLLRAADAIGASELFLVSQARPYVRVGGNVRPLADEAPLLPSDIEALIADVTPEPWRDAVRRGDPAEWLIELADIGRVRCSTFRDQRGPGANFHFAFLRATTADELQLSADTRLLATEPDGLILVAGSAGSDASAIVAAFVDILNQQRADYIITLEPQIRVLHVNREALVSQREVGHDGARALAAARAALREEPDVLVIESVATGEMAQVAIEAAAQDRLVIASVDAPSGVAAVQRLVELVPVEQRQAVRATLARCFRGAVAQLLLRKAAGGRIAARELLSGTRAVARILAEGDLTRLAEPLETPGAAGMAPLTDAIVEYVRAGLVDVREAARKVPDADSLLARLKAAGVDLSAIERWN